MTTKREVSRYLDMVRADVQDYHALRDLLDAQFEAALRHQVERVRQVCSDIAGLVDVIDQRRAERMTLASALTKQPPAMAHAALQRRLGAASASLLADWTRELEGLVRECKRLNLRNCSLLTEQHEIMQRVLQQEVSTYAPA
ncbi:flagellar export chaperone FlgN [Hydrogenophaga aquatica]